MKPLRHTLILIGVLSLAACQSESSAEDTADATAGSGGTAAAGGTAGSGGTGAASGGTPSGGTPTDAAPAPATDAPDAASLTDAGATSNDAAESPPDAAPAGPDPRAATLIAEASQAICGALFRCCDAPSLEDYFAPYAANERLADFVARLPPAAAVDAATCPALVAEMLTVVPLGAWIDAVVQGKAAIVGAQADACLAALNDAACGEPVAAALFDSTCFWLNPPLGGPLQRSVFDRAQRTGDACIPLADGFGGLFYGTCNPNTDFCCFGEPESCGFPDDPTTLGTCTPAGDVGAACSQVPVRLCRTGLECGDDNVCHAPAEAPLSVGEPCVDASFTLLGLCVDSYCDFFESRTCLARKADGEDCTGPEECTALSCVDGRCAPTTFCTGR
jgi:hypothetical protein